MPKDVLNYDMMIMVGFLLFPSQLSFIQPVWLRIRNLHLNKLPWIFRCAAMLVIDQSSQLFWDRGNDQVNSSLWSEKVPLNRIWASCSVKCWSFSRVVALPSPEMRSLGEISRDGEYGWFYACPNGPILCPKPTQLVPTMFRLGSLLKPSNSFLQISKEFEPNFPNPHVIYVIGDNNYLGHLLSQFVFTEKGLSADLCQTCEGSKEMVPALTACSLGG